MRLPETMRAMARSIERVPSPAEALRLFMTAPRVEMARREAEIMVNGERFSIVQGGDKITRLT